MHFRLFRNAGSAACNLEAGENEESACSAVRMSTARLLTVVTDVPVINLESLNRRLAGCHLRPLLDAGNDRFNNEYRQRRK